MIGAAFVGGAAAEDQTADSDEPVETDSETSDDEEEDEDDDWSLTVIETLTEQQQHWLFQRIQRTTRELFRVWARGRALRARREQRFQAWTERMIQ